MTTEVAPIWVDGEPLAQLPLPDRGLDFGDGLFETLLLHRGNPLYLDHHLRRLRRGLQVLNIPDCLNEAKLQLEQVAALQRRLVWASLRLTVTRGAAERGYAPPTTPVPRIIIRVTAIERDCRRLPGPASVHLASLRCASQPALAGIKHLNRLEQVMAAAEGRAAGVDETVLLDQSGHLVSVAAGNLFLWQAGRLLTPPLDDCGIVGTRRTLLIERWAPALGLAVEQVPLTLGQLEQADEVFYSNSLLGLRPVSRFGATRWQSFELCQGLFQQYLEDLP